MGPRRRPKGNLPKKRQRAERRFATLSNEQIVLLPQPELLEVLRSRSTEIAELRSENKALRTPLRRMGGDGQLVQVGATPNTIEQDFALQRRGRSHKMLSPKGALALALRRNMGNCGASDLGGVLLDDVSRQTVVRSELVLGSCLVGFFKQFHDHHEEIIVADTLSRAGHDDPELSVAFHMYSSDATNSSVWQQSKLPS